MPNQNFHGKLKKKENNKFAVYNKEMVISEGGVEHEDYVKDQEIVQELSIEEMEEQRRFHEDASLFHDSKKRYFQEMIEEASSLLVIALLVASILIGYFMLNPNQSIEVRFVSNPKSDK